MTSPSALAGLAALLADETRAAMCLALLDGRAWTAGELARHVGVAPSTATEHLHRLVAGGLLIERRQGRHRYVQLADESTAHLLEDLTARSTAYPRRDPAARSPGDLAVRPRRHPAPATGLRAATASAALRRGRTCYDHLAGRLGVAVTEAMVASDMLDVDGGFALTPYGKGFLSNTIGVDLQAGRRPLARGCLDWTERRQHLAGVAGARLCATFLARRWVIRIGSGRAVRLTPDGGRALRELLALDTADL